MDLIYLYIQNSDYRLLHKAGRYILEYAAKNFYNIKDTELETVNKKPKFKYSNIKFSISHSKDIAAVCFDKNPVGFDIEKILPLDYKAIAKRMNFILEEESLEEFYKIWTMYESKIKLQEEFKHCICQKLNDNYMFSIVSTKEFNIDKIKEINFIND